ncbi:MAG: S8 family serine peptidase [Bdellovibrionaceae bacterium]|nr:S8 family serine peptidase [Pseudobdellovibrionaceae bacterium]
MKLKPMSGVLSINNLERALGAKIKERVSPANGVLLVQRSLIETADSAINTLAHHPMIEYAEPNYIYRMVGGSATLPSDPALNRLWGMINTGQQVVGDSGTFTGKAGIDIDAQKAWLMETGSREVVVAVIDTGVNWRNPDLAPNIFTNKAELNGIANVDDDGNGCVDDVYGCDFVGADGDPMDVFGHGTHVAGTIGALGNNNNGIVGVAWNVRILPVRFLGDDGSGTLANAIKAIDYAVAMKADIMNNSWGGGGFSQALVDSIIRAKDAGILFLAAAGNNGNDNDASPEYPASYQVDNVISVAAMDPTGMVADFSNFGRTSVHIAAPGVNIVSYTMRGLESWSGTSMACPHVAGVAALLLSQDMTQSYSTIRSRLLNSARPMGSLRGRVATGMVNAYHALSNTVAAQDPEDPFYWQKKSETISTLHPYAMKTKQEWIVTVPGAKKMAVYFSRFETEAGYDKVTFRNSAGAVVGTMSGKLGEVYGPVVEGTPSR